MRVSIASTNKEQAQAWNGAEGAYWARRHDILERVLDRYQPSLLEAAAIRPTDHVLDVGCGTGVLSRVAGTVASSGQVLGVDLSEDMVAVARRLAADAGLANVSFLAADAQVHPFPEARFDVVVSSMGSMFFGDPTGAFRHLHRSLRPGGRLVMLTWRSADQQEWLSAFSEALVGRPPPVPDQGAPGPFSLGDEGRVRVLLETSGFAEVASAPIDELTTYGRTVEEALEFLLGLLAWMVRDHDPDRLAASTAALRDQLAAHLTPDGVRFRSAAWLTTAERR